MDCGARLQQNRLRPCYMQTYVLVAEGAGSGVTLTKYLSSATGRGTVYKTWATGRLVEALQTLAGERMVACSLPDIVRRCWETLLCANVRVPWGRTRLWCHSCKISTRKTAFSSSDYGAAWDSHERGFVRTLMEVAIDSLAPVQTSSVRQNDPRSASAGPRDPCIGHRPESLATWSCRTR